MVLEFYIESLRDFCNSRRFPEEQVYYVLNLFKQIYFESEQLTRECNLILDEKEKILIRKQGLSLESAVNEIERFMVKQNNEKKGIGKLCISYIKNNEIHYTPEKFPPTSLPAQQVEESHAPITRILNSCTKK